MCPMSPRLLRPLTGGVHPDAAAWRSAVVANGGSVSASTMQAVSTFCASIDAAGIRDKFYRLNLFCGSNLNAALVPLYRSPSRTGTQFGNATDTNVNFVSGDYSESQGISSDVAGKVLNTGLLDSVLPASQGHLAFSGRTGSFVSSGFGIGFGNTQLYRTFAFISNSNSVPVSVASGSSTETIASIAGGNSFHNRTLFSRTSLSAMSYYRNGAVISTNTTLATATTSGTAQFSVFGVNGNAGARIGFHYYSVGDSVDATQAAAFDAALAAFLTALGRS
jgi:hypothetical protein